MRRRKRINRRKIGKQRKIIVISLICFMFIIVGGYATFQANLNITAKGNIISKDRVIQNYGLYSDTDFHSDYYKENIVNATFLDNNNIPSNAVESWNISADKNHGGVMAWVVQNSEDNTKFDLYIGANNGVIANENSGYLFYGFQQLSTINFNNSFSTKTATTMEAMFFNCRSLTTLDLSSFDTSNVTTMNQMFNRCINLQEIKGLENFNTNKVTNMYAMFHLCESLKELNLDNFNTSNVISMSLMFYGCKSLKSLNLSSFDTSNITNLEWFFGDCSNLETVNVSNFNTSNVTNMGSMFSGCQSLKELNLCSFNTNNVRIMWQMFYNTQSLSKITVNSNWVTTNANTGNIFLQSSISSVTTGQC